MTLKRVKRVWQLAFLFCFFVFMAAIKEIKRIIMMKYT